MTRLWSVFRAVTCTLELQQFILESTTPSSARKEKYTAWGVGGGAILTKTEVVDTLGCLRIRAPLTSSVVTCQKHQTAFSLRQVPVLYWQRQLHILWTKLWYTLYLISAHATRKKKNHKGDCIKQQIDKKYKKKDKSLIYMFSLP